MTTKGLQCLISFLYAHSWAVYQCTLNVLISFIQWFYTLDCVDIVSSTYISIHIPHCVSHMGGGICCEAWYMPECLYWHWENNDQNVFMGWYCMVYYLSNTVCVFYFPRSWCGMIIWCFYQKPESLRCQYEIPITLTNLTFLFAVGLYFSPEVCLVMFSLYCYVWRSKLFLGTQPA